MRALAVLLISLTMWLPVLDAQEVIVALRHPTSGGGGTAVVTKIAAVQGAPFTSPYTTSTLSAAVPAGAWIKGFCTTNQANGGTTYAVPITDTKSNTWTTNLVYVQTTFTTGVISATTHVTNALTTSDTITITPANDGVFQCVFYSVTGITLTTEENATGNVTTTSNPAPTASITPGAATSVVFAVFGIGGTWSAYGNCMGGAATGLDNLTQASGITLVTEYRQLSSATAGTCGITQTAVADAASVVDDLR